MMLNANETRDAYDVLTEKVRYPNSKTLRQILELWCTPEEAQVLAELPSQVDEIANKLNRDPETVKEQIASLYERELVQKVTAPDGTRQYHFVTSPENLIDGMLFVIAGLNWDDKKRRLKEEKNRRIAELCLKFSEEEWYRWERPDEMIHRRMRSQGGKGTFTVFPAWLALLKSGLSLSESDYYWDLRSVAEKSKSILVAPCPCRVKAGNCDSPIYTDTMVDLGLFPMDHYYDMEKRGVRVRYSPEQWVERMVQCEEMGMIHLGVPPIAPSACTCCNCCCNALYPLIKYAKPSEGLEKAPFRAVVDKEVCRGCPDCIANCRFEAVKIEKDSESGKNKATVDVDKCFGCGQCVVQCKVEGAIRLQQVT